MVRFLFFLVVFIGLVSGGTIYFWWKFVSGPVDVSNNQPLMVVIPKGASAAEVGKILFDKGIIKDPFVFRLAAQVKGKAGEIIPGAYKLSPDKPLLDTLLQLLIGPSDIRVTIPEGFRREQIAARLKNSLGSQENEFNLKEFILLTNGLEGQLFPDTYEIPQDATPQSIITMMTENFDNRTSGLFTPPFPDGLTIQKILTVSSIIERETKDSQGERPIVAGILLKRLQAGWPIQADATLQYAKDSRTILSGIPANFQFWQPITPDDKLIETPFNTYLHVGLPPSPISNPGLSAIKAVLDPQNSPYWFYLHAPDGTIHFAATLEEQQANITKYL